MSLTPATIRLDLKCGNGAISAGEKCKKGSATQVGQEQTGQNLNKAKVVVASAGALGLATAAFLTRKKWTAAANKIWKEATPYNPSNPPSGAKFFSQGNNGQVWVSQDGKSIIKIPKHRKAANQLADEVAIQSALHDAGVKTPAIYNYDKGKSVVHMEFLSGYKPLAKALKEDAPSVRSAYAKAFAYELEKTHTLGYSHGDLNFNNAMVKEGKLSLIDWGFASTVENKGVQDLSNLVRITTELDPAYGNAMKEEFKSIQSLISSGKKPTKEDLLNFHRNVRRRSKSRADEACPMTLTPSTLRLDLKCGQSAIAQGKTCHKGGAIPRRAALAAGLTAGAVGAALLLRRRSGGPKLKTPPIGTAAAPRGRAPLPTQPRLPGHAKPSYPALTGTTPRGLLPPGRIPKSKTQRMRENTAAAMKVAEGRISQTAKEEVRRIAQIGNTMAATGEAAGMATKTTLRELRIRAEAARRRYEPGYRRNPKPAAQAPRTLAGGASPVQIPFSPAQPLTPERVSVDPRTGQPRRRKARGFTGDAEDDKKYTKVVTNPKTGRKNRVRYGAKGYSIAPGTSKGDNYCARSFGDMKSEGYNCSGAERNTPLCLSRAKWKCSGKTSRRDAALTPGKSSAW